ncbi:MAG: AAA family ATPase, partial [Acidimicrobiales bacterium]
MIYRFDEFEIDVDLFELRRNGEAIHLEPQVFGVLVHLIEHRDRVVSKIELLDEVWTDRFVSESALTSRIQAARKACGDNGREQRVIQTRHGRGYRFVASVEAVSGPGDDSHSAATPPVSEHGHAAAFNDRDGRVERVAAGPRESMVGRRPELSRLEAAITRAQGGSGSALLVAGPPGSGKSTLVDTAVERLDPDVAVVRAQCHAHRGVPEPYVSLLDAVGRFGRSMGQDAIETIERVGPMWLMQLPSLVAADRIETLEKRTMGGTHQRMLREGVDLLLELAAATPTLLILEDVHWADPSTLEVVEWLSDRLASAPLVLIATYRPDEDLHGALEPVLARMSTSRSVEHLRLGALTEEEIRDLALDRLEAASIDDELNEILFLHSGGNPLFATEELKLWVREGAVAIDAGTIVALADPTELRDAVPSGVRHLIEQSLARLSSDQQAVLSAGALGGRQFPAFVVSAGSGLELAKVEASLGQLARSEQFVTAVGDHAWPDGTVSTIFRLGHDLHQQILADRLPASQRATIHQRIGERLEAAYGHRVDEHVAQLARHFVASADARRAVNYLRQAGEQALARSAHIDAVGAFEQALELIENLPADEERQQSEISIRTSLGPALIATGGWGSPEIDENYALALELCRRAEPPPERFILRYGLASVHELRGEYNRSEEILEEQLSDGTDLGVETLELLACSTFHQGSFDQALEHANAALDSWDQVEHSAYMARYGEHPGVSANTWGALAAWHLGDPQRASDMADRAIHWGAQNHYALATARIQYAFLSQYRGDREACKAWAESTIGLALDQGFPFRTAQAELLVAWSRIGQGNQVARLREGLDRYREFGARMDEPYFLGLLAEAATEVDDPDTALHVLDEAEAIVA